LRCNVRRPATRAGGYRRARPSHNLRGVPGREVYPAVRWWPLLALLFTAINAHADDGREAIPCFLSHVFVEEAGSWECERFPEERNWTSVFQRFNVFGVDAQGYALSAQLFKIKSGGGHVYFTEKDVPDAFRNFNRLTRNARNWSALRVVGNSRLSRFDSDDGRRCAAFIYGEHERLVGYARLLRGIICAPSGQALPDDAIERLMGLIKEQDFEAIR
jgi:hypothetical protein